MLVSRDLLVQARAAADTLSVLVLPPPKDLGLAMELAHGQGVDAQMGKLAQALYKGHQAGGSGARDFSSIMERLKE